MRQLILSLFVLLVLSDIATGAPLLKIGNSESKGFKSAVSLSSGRQWWGNVAQIGDTLDLSPGSYELAMKYPPHSLYLNVDISDNDVKITKWHEGEPECGITVTSKVIRWDTSVGRIENGFELQIPPPSIEETKYGRRSDCSLGEWTVVKNISIVVSSEPKGADIILDDKKIATTDSTIVAPLREFRDGVYVVVKKTGFASCVRRIDKGATAGDAKCTLRPLK